MNKIFFSILAVVFVYSLCFAQQPTVPMSSSKLAVPENKILAGKVESVSLANVEKGTKTEITVVDESGKKVTFLVKSTVTIYDADHSAITLDKINKDENVKIKYSTTKEGVEEAVSIRVVK